MKVRIKTYNKDLPSYLTVGKEYNLWQTSDYLTYGILADNGHNIVLSTDLNQCFHLNGGSWEFVE